MRLPEPGRFADAWLADAELSLTLGAPDRVGLSFFSTDGAAFDAFTTAIGLPRDGRELEAELRARFDLLPRRWVKLRWVAGARVGYAQYFAIHERNRYPITTLRLFARRCGVRDTSRLEPALAPALACEDARWVMSVQRTGAATTPRFSCRLPRATLPSLLDAVIAQGGLDAARADDYRAWNDRLQAADAAWITLDGQRGELGSLDFEDPMPSALPDGWRAVAGAGVAPPRYLKCRLRPGAARAEWTIYVPAAAAAQIE